MLTFGVMVLGVTDRRRAEEFYPDDPDFVVLADPDGNRFCIVDVAHTHG